MRLPGFSDVDYFDFDEEAGDKRKGGGTKLRVWWSSVRRTRTRGLLNRYNLLNRKKNLALLIFCVCLVYLWSKLSSESSPLKKPSFSVIDEPGPSSSKGRQRSGRHGKHTYRSDGLLELNANATHPVFELITKAEAAWYAKLRKVSVTFQDAVEEYVRRYKRAPPKGFDKWFVIRYLLHRFN